MNNNNKNHIKKYIKYIIATHKRHLELHKILKVNIQILNIVLFILRDIDLVFSTILKHNLFICQPFYTYVVHMSPLFIVL